VHAPGESWNPIMWNGRNLCDEFLGDFKIMPLKTPVAA